MTESPETRPAAAAATEEGLPLGQIVPGTQYRVLAKLGAGGMGAVYAAEHVALERRVAIKVLRSDVAHTLKAIERFRDEARAASKIGNEFICDVTDFGQTADGRVFYVMEHLSGESLYALLQKETRLPPERALPILRMIAKALGAAHDKGIVHLDIKPDNVMLVPRGRRTDAVKVVDFGIARLMSADGPEERVAGTPEYIAPERFVGSSTDHRADIYALGVVAYELLSGSVPIHGPTPIATLTMQVDSPPPPLESRVPGGAIPDELAAVVMQMLEKDPAARPSSMAVVEAMLCEAQIAGRIHTAWDDLELPPVDEAWHKKLAHRMPSPRGRQRKALLVGAFGLALAAGALALYFGVFRAPKVVVKYVAVTQTEEAEGVGAWLEKAVQAANAQRYVEPPESSALTFIIRAEDEHARIPGREGTKSKGAESLRRAYASALSVVGEELAKANLRDLGAVKFREALLFTPDDPTLQAKAEVSAEERRTIRERARPAHQAPTAPAPAPPRPTPPADEAKQVAASVYMAAREGRFSEARVMGKKLVAVDREGLQAAKLADAFRRSADAAWNRGDRGTARPLYELVAGLDPKDLEAAGRSAPEPPPAPPPAPVQAPAPAPPAPAPTPPTPTPAAVTVAAAPGAPAAAGAAAPKLRKLAAPDDVLKNAPRNPAASKAAALEGRAALERLDLAAAESAYSRALNADPSNATAVGGLAEVAFERSRYTEALDYARRAVVLSPKSFHYQLLVGDAFFKLLRYGEAQAAYEKARAIAPQNPLIQSRIERVSAKLKD